MIDNICTPYVGEYSDRQLLAIILLDISTKSGEKQTQRRLVMIRDWCRRYGIV